MPRKPHYAEHPLSPQLYIVGTRLGLGDTLEKTDVYDSTTGKWAKCPGGMVGTVLKEKVGTIWVRPQFQS